MKPYPRLPDGLALLACVILAFLALYNPIFHLPDHVTTDIVPVVTDYFHYHWNEWWMRHALTNGLNVYETNYVFAPATSSLALHPLTPLWYPLWALIEPVGGSAVAMIVVFMAGYTLTGFGFYLLLRDEGISPAWALIGAALLELASLMTTSARWTLINLMAWFWLPVVILTWKHLIRAAGNRRWLWALMLGAVFWGMLLTDLQIPLFAAPLILPYALWTLWRAPGLASRLRIITIGIIAIAVGAMLGSVLGPLDEAIRFDRTGLSPTPADRAVEIEFPTCYLIHCESGVSVGSILFPFLAITFYVWLRWRTGVKPALHASDRAPRWLWLLMIPIPLIFSAGAAIQVGGFNLTLPYTILHQIFGGMVRYPERFLPVFMLPSLMFSLAVIDAHLRKRGIVLLFVPALLLLILADSRALQPMPVQPLPESYNFYEQIASEPYDYIVVEIPTGGASGEGIVGDARYAELQYYGMIHGKRMINGHISRVPTYNYFYMNTDDPMMAWLGQRRFLEPETVESLMRLRIPEWQIGYFVIHRDLILPDQAAINEIITFFNAHRDLFCWHDTERDLVVYRTTWHPNGCTPLSPPEAQPLTYIIDIGDDSDIPFLLEGWYYAESIFDTTIRWAGDGTTASLHVYLLGGDYHLTLTAQSFQQPRQVALTVNGALTGESLTIAPDSLRDYAFDFSNPSNLPEAGQWVTLTFTFDDTLTPRAAGMGEDDRPLAIMLDKIMLNLEGD